MIAALLRWSARLLATAMAALFITFLVQQPPDPERFAPGEITSLGGVALMLLGTALAWRFVLAGGLAMLAGYLVFALASDGWPPLPFGVFLLSGLALVVAAGLRRFRRGTPSNAQVEGSQLLMPASPTPAGAGVNDTASSPKPAEAAVNDTAPSP